MKKTLILNTYFLYLMRICSYIFPLLTMPYLTRKLGTEIFGLYSWTNAIVTYIKLIVDFGFVIIGIELIARYQNNKTKIGKIILSIMLLKVILFIFSLVILFIFILYFEKFRNNYIFLLISILTVIPTIINIDYVYQGIEKMKNVAYRTIMTKILFTIFIFIFIKEPQHYLRIPILTFISDIFILVFIWRNLIFYEKIRIFKSDIKILFFILKKSILFFLSRCAGAVWSSGNIILLGIYYDSNLIAQYSLAFSLIVVLQNMITPISESIYPYMIKNRDFKLALNIIKIFEPLIILGCLLSIFISKYIINFIFGNDYELTYLFFNLQIGIVLITLPSAIFGFPIFSIFNISSKANLSVIYASIFHIFGFFILFLFKIFTIKNICILTVLTEFILLVFRIGILNKNINFKKNKEVL